MFTYGTVAQSYSKNSCVKETKWKIGKEEFPTEKSFVRSPQFTLLHLTNPNVWVMGRLFLDLNKKEIGIENDSSEKGSVVLIGSVSIGYSTGKLSIQNSTVRFYFRFVIKNPIQILLKTIKTQRKIPQKIFFFFSRNTPLTGKNVFFLKLPLNMLF